ncbi:MAG TPA: beta-N-acetylhexosaminidase, partial [Rhizobiaceae bacterium]|nr:beta-N-acetylhexosaminidase [Rhizobiaceae bacterium]
MNESKAMIAGCTGLSLTDEERAFHRAERPWGFILFGRNISEREQIRDLVAEWRDLVGRPDAPIFIDQEGGRVQRIREPLLPRYPSGRAIGEVYARDAEAGRRAAWLMSRLHALDLRSFGITADCLPVLDVPLPGAHDVIGDRAYSSDPDAVADLGRAAASGLMAGGVLPVMKHMPGHGRAFCDSHKELPVVDAPLDDLRARDFVPFRLLSDLPMAMTAHLVFTAIDPANPATHSKKVIEDIIRGEIGFHGLLMSDDVSMEALSGDYRSRALAIIAAGCDVVLHCNGRMDEMTAVASAVPPLAGNALLRAQAALRALDAGNDDNTETALR